jgi:hypothetical protein
MDKEALREHLAKLHAELAGSGPVDPETRALLDDVLRDITRLTADPPAQRLERVAVQFEADHPAIAANVRRLVELLGRAGV